MKASRPTNRAQLSKSLKRQCSISLWTQSCLLFAVLTIPSHIIHSWGVRAEELKPPEIEKANPSEASEVPKLISEDIAKSDQSATETIKIDSTLSQPSNRNSPSSQSTLNVEKKAPIDQGVPAFSPSQEINPASSLESPRTIKPIQADSANTDQKSRPPSSQQSVVPVPSPSARAQDEVPYKRGIEHLPAWAQQFKVDASRLPKEIPPSQAASNKLTHRRQQYDLSDRRRPASTPRSTSNPRVHPDAHRLLIPNLHRISVQTRTNQDFYPSTTPLKRHFRVPRSAPMPLLAPRPTLTSPQGKPAYGAVFISSLFGKRRNPFGRGVEFHNGVDLVGAKGIPILATAKGRVKKRRRSRGYGVHVVIDHGNGYETLYAHLSKKKVKPNQIVRRGDIIGFLGSTGRSTGPHLHYSVYLNRNAVDPKPYLFR